MVWQNVIIALLGIWFVVTPAALPFSGDMAMAWTSVIGGAILLVLAGTAVFWDRARRQTWIQVVNALVGVWFIIAPWVLTFTQQSGDFWTSLIPGIAVLILSLWDLQLLPRTAPTQQHTQ